MSLTIQQFPETGKHLLRYCGDTLEIRLRCDSAVTGAAFLSTNIGHAALSRAEIIDQTESRLAPSGQDWTNVPMQRLDEFTFSIQLALNEVGHFECKACLVQDDDSVPLWVPGDNLHVNVISSFYCCSNSIYCAFVRQFGMNKNREFSVLPEGITKQELEKFDRSGYSLIPPSGGFRGLIRELDHIVGDLKCRIIHLLPVTPTPTVFGRMGRYGSPYASTDFTAVDPSLAEFDKKATPLDQFMELADAIHSKGARLFIDIAINHTGWASKLQEEHPDWFVREKDGSFHSPGAWGVVWGDLVELDHKKTELWKYLADVFLVWCSRGVDGFRCDAGYMIPLSAWRYIVARVRREYPSTVFLLEGLGGPPEVTEQLLDQGNMDWAYSELFQNYSRAQVEGYLKYAWTRSSSEGVMVHYAETHDNSRLAAVSEKYARMRTSLCALASVSGAFGFANGVEWFAREKIDVHESSALNWGASSNQIALISRLNSILALHPAFRDGAMLQILDSHSPDAVIFLREAASGGDFVLAVINLNCSRSATASWDPSYMNSDSDVFYDLLTGKRLNLLHMEHSRRGVSLGPGTVFCLSPQNEYLSMLALQEQTPRIYNDYLDSRRAASVVLAVICTEKQSNVLTWENVPALAEKLLLSPEDFLAHFTEGGDPLPYVMWHFPSDSRRKVMLPPGHCLLAEASAPFRLTIRDASSVLSQQDSLQDASGRHFVLIPPFRIPEHHTTLFVSARAYGHAELKHAEGELLLLAPDVPSVKTSYSRMEIYNHNRTVIQANGRGALSHQCMELERLESRYDAVLLANLNPDFPEDRHIMWRRNRFWIVYQARMQELKHENIESFHLENDGSCVWYYHVPVGNGILLDFTIRSQIVPGKNAVLLTLERKAAAGPKRLPDDSQVRVIVRPDIEDRNFHCATKASSGPSQTWPGAVKAGAMSFDFAPAPDRILHLQCSRGRFRPSPDWQYMIYQSHEADRGLDPYSDLYSPGYFRFYLSGGEKAYVIGQVLRSGSEEKLPPAPLGPEPETEQSGPSGLEPVLIRSMRQFVVNRSGLKTVIAGYPWFLDWGRDTLIAVRGLMTVPEFQDDAAAILLQFASYAENGTIPNMISGGNASNRDTSDAPLWLIRAVRDFCMVTGSRDFLSRRTANGEMLISVLSSLAAAYADGTPNGIRMDPESGLIYSPPHFTWMDTNYPAGTPREGYPVEIQALWFSALRFLSEYDETEEKRSAWRELSVKTSASFHSLFVRDGQPWLSDCLHASAGTPAAFAEADDHLRPNQLLAVTLGLVTDLELAQQIIMATRDLLVPGAIRSLADRPCRYPLPVRGADGSLLNDPENPYRGHYQGDEDTSRKVAYHNGTAWTWLFPSWPEACFMVYGALGRRTAISVLSTMTGLMDDGCLTQVPEILDGDFPHMTRGCDAQAWGITEYCRVWNMLHSKTKAQS